MKQFYKISITIVSLFCLTIVISMVFLTSTSWAVPGDDIKLTDLDLDKKAVILTGKKKKEFPLAERGFLWQSDDSKTKNWRPQGITGMDVDGREFIIVSWYGRKQKKYENRGARISVVDITQLERDPSVNNYRHILLVDKNKNTFPGMHAGGIVALNGKIHVADSRGEHKVIRVFDLNKIKRLQGSVSIYNYRYILMEEYNFKAPINPSYISYDRNKKQILIGTFAKKPSDSKPNLMAWFTPPDNENREKFNENIDDIAIYRLPNNYKKIQGMVCFTDSDNKQILWLSTSYGGIYRSNFYKMNIDINSSTPKSPEIITTTNFSSRKYPPGLEDAYLAKNNQLWLLTEFAYAEGRYNGLKPTRRGVFSIKISNIIP